MAKKEQEAKALPTGKVVFVNFLRRHAEKDEAKRTPFDGTHASTPGTATLLVANDDQIASALHALVDLKKGETLEVLSSRNLQEGISIPVEVDWS